MAANIKDPTQPQRSNPSVATKTRNLGGSCGRVFRCVCVGLLNIFKRYHGSTHLNMAKQVMLKSLSVGPTLGYIKNHTFKFFIFAGLLFPAEQKV